MGIFRNIATDSQGKPASIRFRKDGFSKKETVVKHGAKFILDDDQEAHIIGPLVHPSQVERINLDEDEAPTTEPDEDPDTEQDEDEDSDVGGAGSVADAITNLKDKE